MRRLLLLFAIALPLVAQVPSPSEFLKLDIGKDRHASRFFVERDPLRTKLERLGARAAALGGALAILAGVYFLSRANEMVLLTAVPLLILYAIILRRMRRRTAPYRS